MSARLAPWDASKRTSSEASVRPPAVVALSPYQPVSSTGQSAWKWDDPEAQAQPGPYSPPMPVTGTFPAVRLSPIARLEATHDAAVLEQLDRLQAIPRRDGDDQVGEEGAAQLDVARRVADLQDQGRGERAGRRPAAARRRSGW